MLSKSTLKKINYIPSLSFLLGFLFIISNMGCKKYEENPLIVLKSKKQRLLGSYDIYKFTVNGNDSTTAINQQLIILNGTQCSIDFNDGDNQQRIMGGTCYGNWSFVNKKEQLLVDLSDDQTFSIGPFLTRSSLEWTITKLVEGQVHLKVNYNNSDYVLQLHKRVIR